MEVPQAMYLKRLTCLGFKSFADKTEFDFQPGVTGIVGPNGCGKSNVVDSIKWVLGDQSARSLRGKQMQDVIFNGSGTRKPSGLAEVQLLFDNADRKLPCDAEEVTITRRLYRSGESQYLINNETVRLKDIRELFMDTGIGVGAYSIIEQGRVDVLLQANPAERRFIFEEAAGISRYKARKREAERKLERVGQNLLRVEDIVEELDKRLRSIKYQAGKARNFQVYDRQLREKRSIYSLAEYHRLTKRRGELDALATTLEDQAIGLRTGIDGAETRGSVLDGQLMGLESEVRQLEQSILGNTAEISTNRERCEAARQRVEELAASRDRACKRLASERQRTAALRQQIESEQQVLTDLESEIQRAHAGVDELAVQDRELSAHLAALRARSEDEQARIIELLRKTAHLNNEISSCKQRREQLEDNRSRLTTRRELVGAELEQLTAAGLDLERQAGEVAEQLRGLNASLEDRKRQAADLDAARAELNQQLASAKEYRSGLTSRRQLLSDLDRRMEGVDSGVRELLHRKEQGGGDGAFGYVEGMVADLIAAEVANAALVEIALGEYDQYLVVRDSTAFIADAEALADFPGRVRAVCLDRLPEFQDGVAFEGQDGFVARAIDLVRYPAEAGPLVPHLLGRTVIVRSLADAQRMSALCPPTYRFVTQRGELLDVDGRCQLGPAAAGAGLISRKSELRDIDARIQEVDGRIAEMAGRLDNNSAEIGRVEREQEQLRAGLSQAHRSEVEVNSARNVNRNAVSRLNAEQPIIEAELASIAMQIAEAGDRESQRAAEVASVEQDNAAREARVAAMARDIVEAGHRRSALTERLTQARVAVGQMAQRRTMLGERLRGIEVSARQAEEAASAAAREADDASARQEQTERTILGAGARLAELYAIKEQLDGGLRDLQHRRERLRLEVENLAAQLKTMRSELGGVEEHLHARKMELQEVTIRVESLVAKVREELGVELAEVYSGYEHAEQDWAALEAEIEDLKEKIRRLGNVNLDAIAEQDELEQRATFLTAQRDDLRTSQKQLEELIEQLNQECRERFATTFETVRGHFQELFRRLFGGGKADVMLEQPAEGQVVDVLEAGIDIAARPPGKENRNISLLSGGEKTMTAIALLLAIFRSRPSPFAILDEVDAALDEANNERFNRIIGDFLEHSQFLIITHSKRTMTIADVLYGVTMQEAGVSKRVSVKFDSNDAAAA